MENMKMTPWTRVEAELTFRKKDLRWLAEQLEIPNIQRLNHWKNRGVPLKYHKAIEDVLGKHRGWIVGEDAPPEYPKDASSIGALLASVFDTIPETDMVTRGLAFHAAVDAITKVRQRAEATRQASPGSEKPKE